MAQISKIGGGRCSVLDSKSSPSQKPGTSPSARMLNASEKKSLREFANSRIKSGSVVVRESKSGRFVVSSKAPRNVIVKARPKR